MTYVYRSYVFLNHVSANVGHYADPEREQPMTFAEKLKELRKKKQISAASLATQCGITYAAMQGYEQNRRIPPFKVILKLAAALGVVCRAFAACELPDRKEGNRRSR